MRKYRGIRKTYYDLNSSRPATISEAQSRRNSISSIQLDFTMDGFPAFIMYCDEIVAKITGILRACRAVESLINGRSKGLPSVAIEQFVGQAIVDEIQQTNEVENVHSTRKEIHESMDEVQQGGHGKRFAGMIRKYILLGQEKKPLRTCQDIRKLYDDFILDEIKEENPKNVPDGIFFRKEPVAVHDSHDRNIHNGLFPESAINAAMENALAFLNDDGYDPFVRVAAFHYMFGYIHPFYDGNGRMARFISSYVLAMSDVPNVICYRLSYVIKSRRKEYYDLFKDANDRHNYGDMTSFVIGFLDMLRDAAQQTFDALSETSKKLDRYSDLLTKTNLKEDQQSILWILIQLSVCSPLGMDYEELGSICKMSRSKLIHEINAMGDYVIKGKNSKKNAFHANLERLDLIEEQPT